MAKVKAVLTVKQAMALIDDIAIHRAVHPFAGCIGRGKDYKPTQLQKANAVLWDACGYPVPHRLRVWLDGRK